jgi:LysR family transcriptional regulator for bpeEF and oprC
MNLDKLRSMEVFMSVVDHGSLSTAATALSLSPSMVSTHLSNLERALGVRLLNRTTRRINLTDEGSIYYSHCRHLLDELADVESRLCGSQAQPRGRLRVDAPSIIGQYLVVPMLDAFRQRYPDIQLDFSDSEQLYDTVESQHDVIIRLGPLGDSSMIARPLGHASLLTVASPRYLATHQMPQVPEDLRDHDCISYRDTRTGRMHPWSFEQHGHRKTLELPSNLSITQGCIQIEAALSGQGVMQGMGFYLEEHLRSGALCQILCDWVTDAPTMEMLYPQGRRASRKVHAFVDFMLEHYPADRPIAAPPRFAI